MFMALFSFTACGQNTISQADTSRAQESELSQQGTETMLKSETVTASAGDSSQQQLDNTEDRKILIAFFSRADENYGVGVIEKGNTHIVAEMIAEEMGGDLFHIQRVNPYPVDYDECTDVAKQEKSANARPELNAEVQNFEGYEVVYLGFPIWWGDMPMAVYTFLESYDFAGKTVIPFSTHEGSGLGGTVESIKESIPQATVVDGFTVSGTEAQNNQEKTRKQVVEWLKQIMLKK